MKTSKRRKSNRKNKKAKKDVTLLFLIKKVFNYSSKRIPKVLHAISISKLHPQKNNRGFKFTLLPDKPLSADQKSDVRFGHNQIAETITQLINRAAPPFTIGLFGKWGSGKSTIISLVKDQLKNDDIKSIVFDAWKYEDDSLRRQLLITLDEELNLGLNYKAVLNQTLTKPLDLGLWNNAKQIFKTLLLTLFYTIPFVIIYLLLRYNLNLTKDILSSDLVNSHLLTGLFNFSIILVIVGFLQNAIKIHYGSIQESKTDSAEGFEDRFYNEVLTTLADDKLLIIIDNLDRTRSDKATSLLSDIKTFLAKDSGEQKRTKAIFLIACDDVAIKRHLEKSNFDNPDEFLRKFFNASLRIPLFLDVELDSYTNELIGNTKIKEFIENKQLAWLITYSFRGNPREIKQFINTLITQYLLAKNMESAKQVKKDSDFTQNIEFLAKVLIIKQKFPKIFTNIEEKALRESMEWKDIEQNVDRVLITGENPTEDEKKENSQFQQFVKDTESISIGYLPLFIRLRQSEEEQKLPVWDTFVIAAIDKQIENAQSIFNKIKSPDQLKNVDELSKDFVRKRARRASAGEITDKLLSFGSTLIKVAQNKLSDLDLFLTEFIPHLPDTNSLMSRVTDFPVTLYFDVVYPAVNNRNKEIIVDRYLSLFRLSGDNGKSPVDVTLVKELFDQVIKHPDYFAKEENRITEAIEKFFSTEDYLEIFAKPSLSKFISDKAQDNFIQSITVGDLENLELLQRKLEVLNRLHD